MRLNITALAVAALIVGACALYAIKYDTSRIAADVSDLTDKIAKRETEIAVMRAEKANLLRPARIDALVTAHLPLHPITPRQLGRVADLPWKGDAPEAVAEAPPVGLQK
jgi:hypothetical protein